MTQKFDALVSVKLIATYGSGLKREFPLESNREETAGKKYTTDRIGFNAKSKVLTSRQGIYLEKVPLKAKSKKS